MKKMSSEAQKIIAMGLAWMLVFLGMGGCIKLSSSPDKEPLVSIKAETSSSK